ncbi:predicted protein [Uncinocarpus reesii 1704]|uniref:Uncharacterized protein n=1 Tax=Uncinocarpus reesii (strain UAMH 1704) TaxID=336963 RepID=C4JUX7_UNCRE|nr:uncharacterized protein UREG_04930 [Uncinocarpus reesii 1704]EEP80088.1 predicted protein [Uncinocarpus reesii 1704]
MVLPRSTAAFRTFFSAQSTRAASRTARSSRAWQQASWRNYATEGAAAHKSSSDMPWLIGSVVVTVPCAYFLYKSGPSNEGHGHGPSGHAEHVSGQPHVESHAAKPEEEEKLGKAELLEEQAQEQETPHVPVSEEEKAAPVAADEARNIKEPGSYASMSGKQAGLTGGDTHHPILKEEELAEGNVESARAKGTVSSDSAQHTKSESEAKAD